MIVSDGQMMQITRASAGALADTTPLMVGGTYYSDNMLQLTGEWAAYGAMYRTQPWVYTLVRKVSVSGSRLPLLVHERADDGSRPPLLHTPYGDLLATPSSVLDAHTFWLWIMSTYEIYGEAILWKWRDLNGKVIEMLPLHPTNVTARRAQDGTMEYLYMPGTRSGSPIPPIPATDIVHFKSYNPDTIVRGMSWLEPLRQTLLADDASRRAQSAQWRNGARPSVVLTSPNAMSDMALKRVSAAWGSLHTGVDQWAKTVILEEGMTVQPFQMTAIDMQYIEARQLAREECCAVADVPPPVVHILDRATFSNITEQMRSMYRDTMAPRLDLYESVLDKQLRPDFDPSGTMRAAFDMNEVLMGSPEAQTESDAKAIQSGVMTPNEARARRRMPPLPDGDRLIVNSSLVPLGTVQNTDPIGTNVIEHPQSIKTADIRALMGRLSRLSGLVQRDEALKGSPQIVLDALDNVPTILNIRALRLSVALLLPEEPNVSN